MKHWAFEIDVTTVFRIQIEAETEEKAKEEAEKLK